MKGRAVFLAVLLGCLPLMPTGGADAQGGEGGAETQSRWRETALCGLSMMLPLSMFDVTVKQCIRAYVAWIE